MRRLARAWEELPDRSTPAAAALQIELAVDGLYELDFEQTVSMGHGALAASRATGDRVLIAAAASALALGEAAAGQIGAAREHREEAAASSTACRTPSWRPGWRRCTTSAGRRTTSSTTTPPPPTRTAASRSPGPRARDGCWSRSGSSRATRSRCRGAWPTRSSSARRPSRRRGCRPARTSSRGRCASSRMRGTTPVDLEAAIAAAEESARVGGRLAGDTMPAGGGGPGWVLGMALFEAGEIERAREIMHSLGSDDLPHKIPVEKCFDWEVLALVELARGRKEAAEGYVRRTEEHAAKLGLRLPTALALRARAAVLLADDEPLAAAELAKRSAEVAAAAGARLPAAFSLALAGRALAAGGEREEAIAVLRQAESELDACGAIRVRDEMRRELRRLGVPTEPPGLRGRRAGVSPSCSASCGACGARRCRRRWAGRSATPSWSSSTRAPTGRCRHPTTRRSVAPVERDGRQFAALVYDASLDDDPELVEAVAAAAAIALENELLQAESQDRLAQLQASRERIVAAGDAERRRLERNLHDGAQQRLVALALQLRLIQAHIRRDPSSAEALVTTASDELAAVARGAARARARHPPGGARTRDRVRAGVAGRQVDGPDGRDLRGDGAPSRSRSSSACTSWRARHWPTSPSTRRRPPPRSPSRAPTAASRSRSPTTASAAPTPARGSGLRGLADRVEALGGHLLVTSPAGAGTVVTADLPCRPPARRRLTPTAPVDTRIGAVVTTSRRAEVRSRGFAVPRG